MIFSIRTKLFLCLFAFLTACTSVHVTTQSPTTTATVIPPSPTIVLSATPLPPPQAVKLGVIGKGSAQNIAWAPDSSLLAVASLTGIYLYDTRTWEVARFISKSDIEDKSASKLAFSPDGKDLVIPAWGDPTTFWRYNLQTGKLRLWFEVNNISLQSDLVFSPDGKIFALLDYVCEADIRPCPRALELRDGFTGELIYQLQKSSTEKDNAINRFVFSPDGKQIAGASNDNHARVWDTSSGSLLYEFLHDSDVNDVSYSPDGSVLASASKDATLSFWNMKTGENMFVLRSFKQDVQRVAYIKDGEKLLVGQIYSNNFQEYTLDERYLPVDLLDIVLDPGKKVSEGYRAGVTVKISPDTHMMAALLNDTVQIWNLDSRELVLILPGYNSTISKLAFSPDGSLMAIADHFNVHLWDMPTQTWIAILPTNIREIYDIAFRPNSHQMVIVTTSGDVQFWDTRNYQKIRENSDDVDWCTSFQIAFSPDGKKMATSGWCGMRIWESDTGRLEQKLAVEQKTPFKLAFSPDGTDLLYVDTHSLLRWNLETGKIIYSVDLPGKYTSWSVAFGSKLMVLGQSPDGPFLFFDPITGQHLYDFAKSSGRNIIALHPDQRLFARAESQKILLTDAASGKEITTIDFDPSYIIMFSPNRQTLAASSRESTVHLWNIAPLAQRVAAAVSPTATPYPVLAPTPTITPEPILPISIRPWLPPTLETDAIRPENISQLKMRNELGFGYARVVAWSAKGDILAIGGGPGIFIFQLGAKQPLRLLPAEQSIFRLAFSPDGHLLAGQMSNDSVRVWEIATYRSLYTLKNTGCWNRNMAFSPDSQILSAVCGEGTYRWNMADGQLLSRKEDGHHADVNPDGHLAADMGTDWVRLVSTDNGQIIRTFDVPGLVPHLARFSPDGKKLLIWFYQFEIAPTGVYLPGKDHKNLIQIWNITPGQIPALQATLTPGKLYLQTDLDADFHGLEFSPDSRRVLTASGEGHVQIWDITSGNLLSTLPDGYRIFLSPDGTRLAALGKEIQVWDVSPGKIPVVIWNIPGFGEFQYLLALAGQNQDLVTVAHGEFRFWAHSGITVAAQPSVITAPDPSLSLHAVSPDGKWLAYSTDTDLILGENAPSHPNWRSLDKFSGKSALSSAAVVFSPDSSRLAVIDADRKILVWQLNELQAAPLELARGLRYVTNLVFSPDSQLLLGLGVPGSAPEEQSVYLWDIPSGKLLRTWKTKGYPFVFDPSGVVLAVGDYAQNKILLFDLRTWELLWEIQGQKYISEIAFSPDGSLLVINNRSSLTFWDIANDKSIKTIDGAFGRMVISADGKELITSMGDGRIQIWGLAE